MSQDRNFELGSPSPRYDPDVGRSSRQHLSYDAPADYSNVDDALAPGSHPDPLDTSAAQRRPSRRLSSAAFQGDYDVPDSYVNIAENIDVSPIQNPYEDSVYQHHNLEQVRSQERRYSREQSIAHPEPEGAPEPKHEVSRRTTQFYTVSYLIFFSILGTLARLGLQALTKYPGTPIIFPSIWPNFAGSLVMGFLSEDRMLFRGAQDGDADYPASDTSSAAKRAHAARKKTIPLYIGLATGFCGSFTSFSAFIRDTFLALANDLPPHIATPSRNGGYSFLALLAVPITTISLSLAGLFVGAHLAIALSYFLSPSAIIILPPRARTLLDHAAVPLGWGCWLGAVLMSALPPNGHDAWRGQATLALVFAPLGCLVRFWASLKLNGRFTAFPLGTFVVNVAGTAVLAVMWDLEHVRAAVGEEVISCQVLAGVQDGFCGCLTTVSTWVGELAALRRRHAYVYGVASVLSGFALMVAIAGGVRWSAIFEEGLCS
ncbi:putative UPF0695 membrane protein [Thermochaetoides thermophila DSM 1495]|uniref:Putative UPF0695 membrane protein n=1 Tax=Chaetomium thermophilum (strain DSM 1495 / CBS 144.50 / IMI 039719) TaxID=759272 RepID=G0S6M1_CHATD|nr:putative UPF0695 membrane protein [Thermochaetoides thermophila DSM 1495]EGS20832.1 putative UPF0695 membrane protein [Thermochaetoides thermophila DSM 1495]